MVVLFPQWLSSLKATRFMFQNRPCCRLLPSPHMIPADTCRPRWLLGSALGSLIDHVKVRYEQR